MNATTRKIALEEHFMAPGFESHSRAFIQHMAQAQREKLSNQLEDIGELRIAEMDRAGIDYAVLSQTGPAVQAEKTREAGIARARQANDWLAEKISGHSARFGGFAALPMQDARAAAQELERAVQQLGFKGALVNGHTHGTYYDAPEFDVFWERLEALEVPFYLHPINMQTLPSSFAGHPELEGAAWGWGVETGTHALRLLFGGVFDRFPGVKVIVGHMGEGLPFLRWRFDSRFAAYPHGVRLALKPSEYFGRNLLITTSGVCSHPALLGAIGEMGAENVMFSVDYPYESTAAAAEFIESAPIDEATRARVCHGNASRLFKLGAN